MRAQRSYLLILLLVGLTFVHRADAQVLPGQRVRVMESTGKRPLVVGQLVRQTNDSIVIRPDSAPTPGNERVLVLERGRRIEYSAGFRRQTRKGMGVGLLVGVTAGAVIGAGSYSKPNCSSGSICFGYGRRTAASAGAVLLGLPVMVIGGIIGASSPVEAWRGMPARNVRVLITPTTTRSVRLTASVAF